MKLLTLAVVVAIAGPADARVLLKDDPTIERGLTNISIGRLIYKGCDTIEARKLKAVFYALSLKKRAKGLGYSDDEIDAYLDSDPDKDRVKAKARAYLQSKGVDFAKPATLCSVGAAEINDETPIGQYLRLR